VLAKPALATAGRQPGAERAMGLQLAPGNHTLVIAIHDDAAIPPSAAQSDACFLRQCFDAPPSCDSVGDAGVVGALGEPPAYSPRGRVVRWSLDGEVLDSFGPAAVQAAVDFVNPVFVYVAVGDGSPTALSSAAAKSLSDVSIALRNVPRLYRRRVFLLFPRIAGHVPDERAHTQWAAALGAVGHMDGDVGEIAFSARARCFRSATFSDAAAAAAAAVSAADAAAAALIGHVKPTRPARVQPDRALRCGPEEATVWSGALVLATHSYGGFELVDWRPAAAAAPVGRLGSGPGRLKGIMNSCTQLGAFVGSVPSHELRLLCDSEQELADGEQPELHKSASLCAAWRSSGTALLFDIGGTDILCSWRSVAEPASASARWACVAFAVPRLRGADAAALDVATFRRSTLGLEGRTPIYGPERMLERLPKVELARGAGGCGGLRLALAQSGALAGGAGARGVADAVKDLSRGRTLAPQGPPLLHARPLSGVVVPQRVPRKSDVSAPERQVLAQWDVESARKRKARGSGIDDALLTGDIPAAKRERARRRSNSAARAEQDNPAAAALRGRRSFFPVASKLAASRQTPAVQRTTPSLRFPQRRPSPVAPRSGRATPSSSLPQDPMLSSRSLARPDPSPCATAAVDRTPPAAALSCVLEGLAGLRGCAPRSPQLRPNRFSVGTSPAVAGWRELAERELERAGQDAASGGDVKPSAKRFSHGVDMCIDVAGPGGNVELATAAFERLHFAAGVDHKSALGPVSPSAAAVEKLRKGASLLTRQEGKDVAPVPPARPRLGRVDVAEALASFVRREDVAFTVEQLAWLPDLLRANCIDFSLSLPALLAPSLSPAVLAEELLRGRRDGKDKRCDGVYFIVRSWIEDVRDGAVSLAGHATVKSEA
jgi:hypothetical protein